MNPSETLARAVRAIAISAETHDAATAMAVEAGFRDPDAARRLYREWVNDMVVLMERSQFAAAKINPCGAFLSWLSLRVASPYHVTFRANDTARARFGDEAALIFSNVRWTQEVAWARRMRGSDNDTISAMAETWLRAARRDPAKMYLALVERYVSEAAMDPSYRDAPHHQASENEIIDSYAGEAIWRPLWLRFSEREFGPIFYGKPRQVIEGMATSVRAVEFRERIARQRAGQASRLRYHRPSLMVGILSEAIAKGLSSDDLINAEIKFIAQVERGELDLSPSEGPAWRVFMKAVLPRFAGTSPAPSLDERATRTEVILSLTPSWTARLPPDFILMGAADRRNLNNWFVAVSPGGRRPPPGDPVVDYGMWLLEARDHMTTNVYPEFPLLPG